MHVQTDGVKLMHVQKHGKSSVSKIIIGRIIKIHSSCGSRIPRIYQAANNSHALLAYNS